MHNKITEKSKILFLSEFYITKDSKFSTAQYDEFSLGPPTKVLNIYMAI